MKVFWIIWIVAVWWVSPVYAVPVLQCDTDEVVNLADYVSMLRDPSGRMTLDEVVTAEDHGKFVALNGKTPSLGFSQDAVWFVFRARSPSARERELVAELVTTRLRDVEWYAVGRDGRVRHASSSMLAQGDVMLRHTRYPLFSFTVWPDMDTRVFFRVQTDTALLIPMRAGSIIGYSQSVESRALNEYGHLGVMLMVMLISLMGALLIRQWLYWLLLCMMGFFAGYDLIYTGIYGWWNGPWIGFVSRQFMLFLANMWVFSMVLFTQRFIGRERLGRGLNCGLNVFVAGMLLGGMLVLVVSYRMSVALTHALVLAGFVAGTVVSIGVSIRHRGDSRLWLIAIPWTMMLIMALVLILQWHGVIPIIASVPVLLRVIAIGVSMLFLLALFEKQLAALRQERQFLRAQRMASEARLESLRYQLNPHFLYNTLNSIEGLSVEAPQRIPALVHRLADFLRARLVPSGDFMVSFGEMLEVVKAYLEIEVVRFEERLCVEYDIAEGLAACRVPEMVLQPLVENAIKHGMTQEEPLPIRIRAWREHRRLYMCVENQGSLVHMPHATLDRSGIGARNVAEQLRHYYGDDGAEFKLSEENGWVVATVCIPVEETL